MIEWTQKNGTRMKCPNCDHFVLVPKTLDMIKAEDWKKIFNNVSRQTISYRLRRWKEFGWISPWNYKSNKIKVKRYYPIVIKQRLEKLNKSNKI